MQGNIMHVFVKCHVQYQTNPESCEECNKSEALEAQQQQHESATTTWVKTFSI
jgi:hypothetical protein